MKQALKIIELIGSKATYTLPLGLAIGLLLPELADFLKAYLVTTLFISLTLALLCTPTEKIISSFLRTKLLVSALIWILVVSPILVWYLVSLVNINESVALAAVFSAAAPPVTATAAIAIFLRLDSAVAACVTVLSMALTPLVLPLTFRYLINTELELDVWIISLQLMFFIFISFVTTFVFKRALGEQKIAKNKLLFDGISVISISLFTIGIMSGVSDMIASRPWFVFENLIVSSVLVLGLYIISTIVFWRAGNKSAMAIGVASGNCNLGLMYLVLVDKVDIEVLIFFSIGQIPMYLLPTLCSPVVKVLRDAQSK